MRKGAVQVMGPQIPTVPTTNSLHSALSCQCPLISKAVEQLILLIALMHVVIYYNYTLTHNLTGTLTLSSERQTGQSVWMSKIINHGLTRSGTGCFIAVPIWQQWVSKG